MLASLDEWTPAQIDRLRKLAQDGARASEIADALGKSRGAVSGKCFRLHIKLGVGRVPVRQTKGTGLSTAETIVKKAIDRAEHQARYRAPPPPPMPDELPPLNLSFEEVKQGMCKWPVNEVEQVGRTLQGSYLFCGQATDDDRSYCSHHRRRGTSLTGRMGD